MARSTFYLVVLYPYRITSQPPLFKRLDVKGGCSAIIQTSSGCTDIFLAQEGDTYLLAEGIKTNGATTLLRKSPSVKEDEIEFFSIYEGTRLDFAGRPLLQSTGRILRVLMSSESGKWEEYLLPAEKGRPVMIKICVPFKPERVMMAEQEIPFKYDEGSGSIEVELGPKNEGVKWKSFSRLEVHTV